MSAELVNALAKAQGEFAAIDKTSTNSHFGSKYADLAAVLNAVRPVLAKHGIAIVQVVSESEHGTTLDTRLLHESGELVSSMPLHLDGLTSQQIGSALTYARRYMALAICGVHPENDDDDGNAATEAGPQRRTSGRTSARGGSGKPSEKQVGYAEKLLSEVVHHSMHAAVLVERTGKPSVDDLSTSECSALIDWLLEEKKAGRTPDGDVAADAADGSEPF